MSSRLLRHVGLREAFLVTAALIAIPVSLHANAKEDVSRNAHGELVVSEHSPLRQRLHIEPLAATSWNRLSALPGMIVAEPSRNIAVLPPVTGRITALDVAPGDHVKRGDVLVEMISGDMATASADESKARAGLVLAQRMLVRAQGVARAGGAADRDVEAAQSALVQAQAEETRAQARLASLESQGGDGGRIRLRAPRDGVVASVDAAAGMNVTDQTAALVKLVDTSEVWAVANIPEDQIALVNAGQQADIAVPALPDHALHGQVDAVEPVVSMDSHTLRARIVLANADGTILPGMFANIGIAAPQPPAVVVPQSALLMNNDQVTVFVEVAPWTFVRRSVDINYDDGATSRVKHGLSAGERIVTSGAILLNDD